MMTPEEAVKRRKEIAKQLIDLPEGLFVLLNSMQKRIATLEATVKELEALNTSLRCVGPEKN
jgi:16S rRNA G527 N7-methylase RsmG